MTTSVAPPVVVRVRRLCPSRDGWKPRSKSRPDPPYAAQDITLRAEHVGAAEIHGGAGGGGMAKRVVEIGDGAELIGLRITHGHPNSIGGGLYIRGGSVKLVDVRPLALSARD